MTGFKILRFFLSTLIVFTVPILTVQTVLAEVEKDQKPVPDDLLERMKVQNIDRYAPIYMRAFKKENVIEVWKQAKDGDYALIKTFPICRWSGKLGPKMREGDFQTPEGFYTITPKQLHPKSSYHLAFNIGFPNTYDRKNERTGSFIMVHGNCVSVGCFAMTNNGIEQIYALAREAFSGGQTSFAFHSFPFRMNGENLANQLWSENAGFWLSLKPAYDLFEITHRPPNVNVCDQSYYISPETPDKPNDEVCRGGQNNSAFFLDPDFVNFTNQAFLYYLSQMPLQKEEQKLQQ